MERRQLWEECVLANLNQLVTDQTSDSYQAIFFDLDHTLIDTRQQYHLGLAKAIETTYGRTAPLDFAERFMRSNDKLWPLYDRRELSMLELRRQRFVQTWQEYGVVRSTAEADAFQEVYAGTFDDTLFCFPGTLEMLAELQSDYRLGIITNGSPDLQDRKMAITGLDKFFPAETVIVSEAIGMAKPHPSVYAAALARLDVSAKESLMVGDNYNNDVLGARRCGLAAVWYAPDPLTTAHVESPSLGECPLRKPSELVTFTLRH